MTQNTQENTEDNKIFIINVIEMTKKDDKKLKEFIDGNFIPEKSDFGSEAIYKNIEAIKNMDKNQQLLVKARAKQLEENNDASKYMPAFVAIITAIISIYKLLIDYSEKINPKITNIIMGISILGTSILAIIALFLVLNSYKRRATGIFFNSLLSNLEFVKESKSDKEQNLDQKYNKY
ncbi:hypothetical protein [Rummeliibacillus pycnus]|uniref:hypothetical protein n=1 Tax=Rummeliibacillus pycnus TaxID=101070 RepID=UPI0037CB9889